MHILFFTVDNSRAKTCVINAANSLLLFFYFESGLRKIKFIC